MSKNKKKKEENINNKKKRFLYFYFRFSPYFVRSSTGSSLLVIVDSSKFCEDVSSVCCSDWLSFGITVVVDEGNIVLALAVVVDRDDERDDDEFCSGLLLDDGIELPVVEASLTDGVVTDKTAGIWKSLAGRPATILIGAWK